MRKMWLALVAVAVLVGVTGASGKFGPLLISTVTPPQSVVFHSGRLSLALERGSDGEANPGPLFYVTPAQGATPDGHPGLYPTGLWAPGDTNHRVLIIRNTGSLDAAVRAVRGELVSGSRLLADRLEVSITTDAAGTRQIARGTLGDLVDHQVLFAPTALSLAPGAAIALHVWVTLPLDAGNDYQGLGAVFSFGIYAEQSRNNNLPPVKPPPELG